MKRKFFCVLLIVLLTLTMMPAMAFASQIDTASDFEGTVYVTYSHDGQFAEGNVDGGYMAYVPISIADIAADSEIYPGDYPYDADNDGVYEVTALMVYQYALERYGQGTDDLNISGYPGSIYIGTGM